MLYRAAPMPEEELRRRSLAIEERDVEQAAADAAMVFLDAVCAPAYLGLTGAQQAFLSAMAPDWPRRLPWPRSRGGRGRALPGQRPTARASLTQT